MKSELTTLARQRETKCYKEKDSRHWPWIINFPALCCSSCMCLFVGFVLTASHLGSYYCLYIVTSRSQLNSLPVFYPVPIALMAFLFEFPSANQDRMPIRCPYVSIFNLGASCYDDLDLENLSFSPSLVFPFSYMFFSFPPSRRVPVNRARKQLQINLAHSIWAAEYTHCISAEG